MMSPLWSKKKITINLIDRVHLDLYYRCMCGCTWRGKGPIKLEEGYKECGHKEDYDIASEKDMQLRSILKSAMREKKYMFQPKK